MQTARQADVWVDGTRLYTGGAPLGANLTVTFGTWADEADPLILRDNLIYVKSWNRTQDDGNPSGSGGIPSSNAPRVVATTFDGPAPVTMQEVPPSGSPDVFINYEEDSTRWREFMPGGKDRVFTGLPNGRRGTAHVVTENADERVRDESGLKKGPHGPLPGVAITVIHGAVGDSKSYTSIPELGGTVVNSYNELDPALMQPGALYNLCSMTLRPGGSEPTIAGGAATANPGPAGQPDTGSPLSAANADNGTCACRDNDPSRPIPMASVDTATGKTTSLLDGSYVTPHWDVSLAGTHSHLVPDTSIEMVAQLSTGSGSGAILLSGDNSWPDLGDFRPRPSRDRRRLVGRSFDDTFFDRSPSKPGATEYDRAEDPAEVVRRHFDHEQLVQRIREMFSGKQQGSPWPFPFKPFPSPDVFPPLLDIDGLRARDADSCWMDEDRFWRVMYPFTERNPWREGYTPPSRMPPYGSGTGYVEIVDLFGNRYRLDAFGGGIGGQPPTYDPVSGLPHRPHGPVRGGLPNPSRNLPGEDTLVWLRWGLGVRVEVIEGTRVTVYLFGETEFGLREVFGPHPLPVGCGVGIGIQWR